MPFFKVTTNKPDVAKTYDADRVYEAVDETDAIAQMVEASKISPDQCCAHRFRAHQVEAPAKSETVTEKKEPPRSAKSKANSSKGDDS